MSKEIDAAINKAMKALYGDVQSKVVRSRLTRWRDVFLVDRIIREEVERYPQWGIDLVDPFTLTPSIPQQKLHLLVQKCLDRIGEERGLSYEEIEAGIERALGKGWDS